MAPRFPSLPPALGVLLLAAPANLGLAAGEGEWALVNIIRHGERSENKNLTHLTPDGLARAEYIANCAGSGESSLAFPLGPPEMLLASTRQATSKRGGSTRPKETLTPLARRINVRVDNSIDFEDVPSFVDYVQSVPAGRTLLVAWQHKLLAGLAKAMDNDGLAPDSWPARCDFEFWAEPEYATGECYDLIWQMVLYRRTAGEPWKVESFNNMHMGFTGSAHAPCMAALRPHSNPSHWRRPAAAGDIFVREAQPPQAEALGAAGLADGGPDGSAMLIGWVLGMACAAVLFSALTARKKGRAGGANEQHLLHGATSA